MSHPSPSVQAGQAGQAGQATTEPSVTLFTNNWTDLRVAAEYAGVARSELEEAVTAGEVRALRSHPDLPGERMVPLADVEAWLRRRELTRAVLA